MESNLGNKKVMAQNIKYYMGINKIERKELAEMVGAPYTTVCDWINAKTYPRIDKIEKMAMVFGISKANLVEERKQKTADDELNEYLDELRNRSEMRMLFKLAKGATKEDVEQAVKIIEALRK